MKQEHNGEMNSSHGGFIKDIDVDSYRKLFLDIKRNIKQTCLIRLLKCCDLKIILIQS
jgi:hypothetical protein